LLFFGGVILIDEEKKSCHRQHKNDKALIHLADDPLNLKKNSKLKLITHCTRKKIN